MGPMRRMSLIAFLAIPTIAVISTPSATLAGGPTGATQPLAAVIDAPLLTVTGTGIAPIVGSGLDIPHTAVDIAAPAVTVFCWTADASAYDGVVTAYRWGRDVTDPNDPEQWETDWVTFSGEEACSPQLTFYFGTHSFSVEVMDSAGGRSRIVIDMNIVTNPLPVAETTWGALKASYR